MNSRRWAERGLWAAVALIASCAPLRPPAAELTAEPRRDRFRAALAEREARGAGVEAELSLWVKSTAAGDLPGAQARLLLASPDAFRLRVASAFGVALDLAAEGDTLMAYVPRDRLGMRVDSAEDSLGVRRAGALGWRIWSAGWRPPASAWERVEWADSLLRLRWAEARDSVALEVGSNGLPVSVTLSHAGTVVARGRYRSWTSWEGVPWPSLLEIEDASAKLRLISRVHRVRFVASPPRERLRVTLPDSAERLSPAGLRRIIERLGPS
jgi:hypothetical protein